MTRDELRTEYEIPEQNLGKLKSKLETLNRKAAKLGTTPIVLEEISFRDEPIKDDWGKETGEIQRYILISLTGETPMVGGYRFVATIQHEEAGNIVRSIPNETVPETYRTGEQSCDHCKQNRYRKDTYIVANDTEFKQVGSGCLRDFTGVNSPQAAAAYAELIIQLDEMLNDDEWLSGSGGEYRWETISVLSWTIAVIRKRGWVSKGKAWEENRASTASQVSSGLTEGKKFSDNSGIERTEEDKEKAAEILTWAKSFLDRDDLNDYEWNMKVAIETDSITWRSLGIVCSLVTMFWRETEAQRRTAEKRESIHVGEIGKRQEFLGITLHKVIIVDGYYGTTKIHKFTDTDGNEIVWFASSEWLEEELTYSGKATVKKHDEFNGINQTIITRAKLEPVGGEFPIAQEA